MRFEPLFCFYTAVLLANCAAQPQSDLIAGEDPLETNMPRGDKSAYTSKQKRQAEHIEEGYEEHGVSKKEAEARAWATVNKQTGGGAKSGSGRGKSATAKKAARKDSARRAVATKHGHSPNRGRASARNRSRSSGASASA